VSVSPPKSAISPQTSHIGIGIGLVSLVP
jgi:hypothetical protein